jgi:hypothetical protein
LSGKLIIKFYNSLNHNIYVNIYIVTYDLHKGATPFDYERLVKLIKEKGSWAYQRPKTDLVI